MSLAPIVLFVYNRPDHLQKTVDALQQNYLAKESEIFVFGEKSSFFDSNRERVREIVRNIDGFKKIEFLEREEHYGLDRAIIDGVAEVLETYGKVIVLEDDIVTSHAFLKFMNDALDFYEQEMNVFEVSGYNYPPSLMRIPKQYPHDIYFAPRNGSWGWATWKNRWEQCDWDLRGYDDFIKNKEARKKFNKAGSDLTPAIISIASGRSCAWDYRWTFTMFCKNAVSVYPVKSFVNNIGCDGSGAHFNSDEGDYFFNYSLNENMEIKFLSDIKVDENILKAFKKVFNPQSSIMSRLIHNARMFWS
jgi:hypothetical protein